VAEQLVQVRGVRFGSKGAFMSKHGIRLKGGEAPRHRRSGHTTPREAQLLEQTGDGRSAGNPNEEIPAILFKRPCAQVCALRLASKTVTVGSAGVGGGN
jgi:hypothetical protein